MKKFEAIADCIRLINSSRPEWKEKAEERLEKLVSCLPSGSGIDNGTKVLLDKSTPERLVLQADFHHMNENGYYTQWTYHEIVVTPSILFRMNLKVSGRNLNNIKEYLEEVFYESLSVSEEEELMNSMGKTWRSLVDASF